MSLEDKKKPGKEQLKAAEYREKVAKARGWQQAILLWVPGFFLLLFEVLRIQNLLLFFFAIPFTPANLPLTDCSLQSAY